MLITGSCFSSDLVPRSRFGGSRTKKQGRGEGKGEEETRSGKIRVETSADWLFTRVFISFARSAKNMPKTFYRAKKNLSRLYLTSTEHDKMYLMFSDTERAVKLGSLIKTLGKIHVSGEDSLSSNCYRTLLNLTITFSELEALKSLCLLLNKKSETAFEVWKIPSKSPGHDKHPHESHNRLAKKLGTRHRRLNISKFKLDTRDTMISVYEDL